MYIKTRVVTAVFRLSISVLSAFASWLLFHIFGNEAWRLFPTWIMLIAAAYYFCLTFLPLFSKRRDSGRIICPTLQGAIVISSMTLAIFRPVFNLADIRVVGLEGIGLILVNFVLPVMFFLDWILFTKKGRWRAVDPFYWLAFLVCYGMWILLSAEFMNTDAALHYPYSFLDFNTIGIDFMLVWFAAIAVVVLALSYICVALDFAMSGKLAKYVVLPHIKTIVVEEEVVAPAKVVKSEAMGTKSELKKTIKPESSKIDKGIKAENGTAAKRPQAVKPSHASNGNKTQARASGATAVKGKPRTNAKPKPKPKPRKQPVALLKAEAESVKQKTAKK